MRSTGAKFYRVSGCAIYADQNWFRGRTWTAEAPVSSVLFVNDSGPPEALLVTGRVSIGVGSLLVVYYRVFQQSVSSVETAVEVASLTIFNDKVNKQTLIAQSDI